MISLEIYKVVHLIGVLTVFLSLGGLAVYAVNGGDRSHPWRKRLFLTHGLGIFLAVLAGFGMLARMGISWPWPGWIASKLVIWVIFCDSSHRDRSDAVMGEVYLVDCYPPGGKRRLSRGSETVLMHF